MQLLTSDELRDEIKNLAAHTQALETERNSLPRNDKQTACRLMGEITSNRAKIRSMKTDLRVADAHCESRERHRLWVQAVTKLYGPDAPEQCFAMMKQLKAALQTVNAIKN